MLSSEFCYPNNPASGDYLYFECQFKQRKSSLCLWAKGKWLCWRPLHLLFCAFVRLSLKNQILSSNFSHTFMAFSSLNAVVLQGTCNENLNHLSSRLLLNRWPGTKSTSICLQVTKISSKEPVQAPKTYDSYANFQ